MKIFVDSSILIEYIKDQKTVLLEEMFIQSLPLYYNSIVLTEYIYYFLGHHGTKSPRTLKENKRIPEIVIQNEPLGLLSLFEQVNNPEPSSSTVIRLMKTYNLLPNDAIILAHCLTAGIHYLASYDSDFQIPCASEGVTLIDTVEVFHTHFPAS
ncbi:type II toxin-antitoxin system VapC family toxin [Larkinella punicea]|uniref:PIN domain-containing protein n=1 Tax=Larkinella punicea TaxID=2315727 RepID=A0A368JS81_9BACT|nr:type II toxin-antitoxin system VapC family toxin [Larkinella punicea]RCR69041.1 PIN domain-containing protein [Larkinella punicea]